MEFHSARLDNGLEIVAESSDEAYSAAVGFFVRTGARDENDAIAGVSHFLEHMLFKGTAKRSADDVNREFDEMGAHYNAFTSEESTIYYAAVLPEQLPRAMDLLADILRPALREKDFETEKQVILEEIRMYEDQPPFGADEKARALHFGDHPLGRSVLGTEQSVGNLPVEAMRDYFQRRYAPGNIVVAAAGRLDFGALVRDAQRVCGDWRPVEAPRDLAPPQAHCGFHVLHKEAANQQYGLMLADGPSADDPHRFAAKLLAAVLGDDSGSRLYWELVDPGLADQAVCSHYEFEGAGLMTTFFSCDPELVAENLQRVQDVYRTAQARGITAAELDQAKSKIRSRIVLSGERPRGRLFVLGSDWLHRHEYRSTEDDLRVVAGLTVENLEAVMTRWPLDRGTTVVVGPLEEVEPPK